MRLIVGCILAVAFIVIIAVPVSAQDRPFRQTHTIEIEVECLDTATEIIRELDGHNLNKSVFSNEMYVRNVGRPGFTRVVERRANFTRRVDRRHFRHVQEVLRGLGEVVNESENAQFLGAQIMDVEVRLAAISQEIERLSVMMAASTSLDVLIAIDIRLGQLNWERNSLMGQRNVLLTHAASPVIHIWLVEPPEDLPEFVPPGFGGRVAESFGDSLWGTLTAAGNLLVFIVRISIPAVIFCVVLAFGVFVIYIAAKRWRMRRLAADDAEISLETADMNNVDLFMADAIESPYDEAITDTQTASLETDNTADAATWLEDAETTAPPETVNNKEGEA